MKKDIEWLKNEVKSLFDEAYESGKMEYHESEESIHRINSLVDQLDEPQKPVIPQFVADYIEQSKKDNDSINQVFAFMDDKEDKDLWHWLFPSMYEEKRANQEVFMRAWLDGYEVEKEPHYYVAFEGEFNLLYVTHVDIYGENGKFSYNSVFDKKHALKFTDKSKAEYLADFLGAIVVEVTE